MIVMQMRKQYEIGLAWAQEVVGMVLAVALQKKEPVTKDRVSQDADLSDVDENGGMPYVVYPSQ
jgi:hypothetical protein